MMFIVYILCTWSSLVVTCVYLVLVLDNEPCHILLKYKVGMPNVVYHLNHRPKYEWYVVWGGSKNRFNKRCD